MLFTHFILYFRHKINSTFQTFADSWVVKIMLHFIHPISAVITITEENRRDILHYCTHGEYLAPELHTDIALGWIYVLTGNCNSLSITKLLFYVHIGVIMVGYLIRYLPVFRLDLITKSEMKKSFLVLLVKECLY